MIVDFPKVPDWDWLSAQPCARVLLFDALPVAEVAARCRSRLSYLATPYSKEVQDVAGAFDVGKSALAEFRAARWVRSFALADHTVVSPIVMSCSVICADIERSIDPLDHAFWMAFCRPLLRACGSVIVPPLDGWQRSQGVWEEASWAITHNIPVYLVADDVGAERGAA